MNLDIEYLNSLMADVSTEIDSKKCIGAERSGAPEGVAVERPSGLSAMASRPEQGAPSLLPPNPLLSPVLINSLGLLRETQIQSNPHEHWATADLDSKSTRKKVLKTDYLKPNNLMYVPTKVIAAVKYMDITDLRSVDKDIELAKEMIYDFCARIWSVTHLDPTTHFFVYRESELRRYGERRVDGKKYAVYSTIIKLLIKGTENGPIIELSKAPRKNKNVSGYSFTARYARCKTAQYYAKTDWLRHVMMVAITARHAEAAKSQLAMAVVRNYPHIQLPTEDEIRAHAKKLKKAGIKVKGDELLLETGKKLDPYLNERGVVIKGYRSVEQDIDIFNHLTKDGYIIPIPSVENAGGRVVDSFTLMPSWIRKLVRINNEESSQVDYKALHPNLAMTIYGGDLKYITHDQVAEYTGKSRDSVKKQHLSYFNMKVYMMRWLGINKFYEEKAPDVIKNIITEKHVYGYKDTSRQMFGLEVEIMTELALALDHFHIPFIQIYDAVQVPSKHADFVSKIMQGVAEYHGVYTTASI